MFNGTKSVNSFFFTFRTKPFDAIKLRLSESYKTENLSSIKYVYICNLIWYYLWKSESNLLFGSDFAQKSIFHEFHEIQSWSIGQTSGYVSIAIKQDFGSPIIDVRLWNALTSWSVDYFISLLIKSAKLLTIERSKQAVALAWYYK